MANMSFEERCPCGASIKVSGYQHHIQPQISTWQRVHDKHANAIAKAVLGLNVGKIVLKTHGPAQCRGELAENGRPVCCIHNPSNHHMLSWEQNWRGDKGMMERVCEHGVGHPDPDDLAVRTTQWAGVHGCDGCCRKPATEEENPAA